MSTRGFLQRRESFGFEGRTPWALDALRLVAHAPRVFEPLVEAWDIVYPGSRKALDRLVELGFITFQPAVVVDMRSRSAAEEKSRRVDRFRLTAAGARLLAEAEQNPLALRAHFRRVTEDNIPGVLALLKEFAVDSTRARDGRSLSHIANTGPLPRRTAYYWGEKLVASGFLRQLPERAADAKDAIPAHWRITRRLSAQLRSVLGEFQDDWGYLSAELRLGRRDYLKDIELVRVSAGGGTDYDHDVAAQMLVAQFITSPAANTGAPIELEPHRRLTVSTSTTPWTFDRQGSEAVYYQPDALFTVRDSGNVLTALEYERFQSRRKAWSHIERMLGFLFMNRMPFEKAQLLFVVDTERREKTYVELIEAFADHALDNPGMLPKNPVKLAVSSRARLEDAEDPLHRTAWFHLDLPRGDGAPVLHNVEHSPFNQYFLEN